MVLLRPYCWISLLLAFSSTRFIAAAPAESLGSSTNDIALSRRMPGSVQPLPATDLKGVRTTSRSAPIKEVYPLDPYESSEDEEEDRAEGLSKGGAAQSPGQTKPQARSAKDDNADLNKRVGNKGRSVFFVLSSGLRNRNLKRSCWSGKNPQSLMIFAANVKKSAVPEGKMKIPLNVPTSLFQGDPMDPKTKQNWEKAGRLDHHIPLSAVAAAFPLEQTKFIELFRHNEKLIRLATEMQKNFPETVYRKIVEVMMANPSSPAKTAGYTANKGLWPLNAQLKQIFNPTDGLFCVLDSVNDILKASDAYGIAQTLKGSNNLIATGPPFRQLDPIEVVTAAEYRYQLATTKHGEMTQALLSRMVAEFGVFVKHEEIGGGTEHETLIMKWLKAVVVEVLENSMNVGLEELATGKPLTQVEGKGLLVGFQSAPSTHPPPGFFQHNDITNVIKGPYKLQSGSAGMLGLSGMSGLSLGGPL